MNSEIIVPINEVNRKKEYFIFFKPTISIAVFITT